MSPRAPLKLIESRVEESFLDYNGHMNDAVYARLFSNAVDAFAEQTGLGEAGRAAHRRTIYTLAALIHYLAETKLGAPLAVFGQIVEMDEKRYRIWLEMRDPRDDRLLAVAEHLIACVDQSGAAPRIVAFPAPVLAAMRLVAAAHARLPLDARVGRGIALRRASA